VLDDHAGRHDGYGNQLHVTAPAIADEITAMAELATGKLGRAPAAVVRGLERFVLPRGAHGSGAGALVRPEVEDMFGLGSREAVLQALLREDDRGFGTASTPEELASALGRVVPGARVRPTHGRVDVRLPAGAEDETGARTARAETLAHAFGWRRQEAAALLRFVPATP
jgi:coenzyme F420-0:L-glutamate ligase/coenzyme F420-1:gamma-L-glutamate ligase